MDELEALVISARNGNLEAYNRIVRQFQDMVVGYAFSVIGDFHLAEDAAQEAFLGAYRDLSMLREPRTFPGWLRRIAHTRCTRITRGKRLKTVPFEALVELPDRNKGPAELLEEQEERDWVLRAVRSLPDEERTTTALFYIGAYSHQEIAVFLDLPPATVNNRLRSARRLLKQRMLYMAKKKLSEEAPSRDEVFVEAVDRSILEEQMRQACRQDDREKVEALLSQDVTLVDPGYAQPSPLHLAARQGYVDLVRRLLDAGAKPRHILRQHCVQAPTLEIAAARGHDEIVTLIQNQLKEEHDIVPEGEEICAAVAQRQVEKVRSMVEGNAKIVGARDGKGNTALHWAVQHPHNFDLVTFLLDQGADIEACNSEGFKAVHLTLWKGAYWSQASPELRSITGYLLARGAKYNINIAAALGDIEAVRAFLTADGEHANFCDTCQKRPLSSAAEFDHADIVALLLESGADPNAREYNCEGGFGLWAVAKLGHLECARLLLEHGANPLGWLDASGPPVEVAMRSGHDEIADLICLYGGACEIAGFMYSENILAVTAMLRANPSLAGEIVGQGARGFNEEVGEKILELCFAEGVDARDMGLWQLRGLRDKPKLLKTVLQHGADPNTARYGATVLHIMAEIGDVGAARVLLECGADIHARDEDYAATPLAWAVVYGKKDMVEFLLENGAEIELSDEEPWAMPLFWAERKGYAEIANLLRRHGGKK